MKRLFTIALILGAFVTLIGLGTWQMQRLAWKEELIAQALGRPTLPAEPLAELLAQGTEDLAYRRAILAGRFTGDPVQVFTTLSDANGPYEGPGYWIMHPFTLAGTTDTLFVNRGFIPFDVAEGIAMRPIPAGTVQFEGLIRPDDPVDWATPEPTVSERTVYRRDIAQMSALAGFSNTLPITVDMPASVVPGLPQAGETKFTFSNRHFEYMLTWYGLAVVLVAVVGVAWWRRRHQ